MLPSGIVSDKRSSRCDGAAALPRPDWRLVERQVRVKLDDWRGLLARNSTDARPVLQELLEAPLQITPIVEERQRGFRFEGAVKVGDLLAGTVSLDWRRRAERTDIGRCMATPERRHSGDTDHVVPTRRSPC